jgi:nucleoid-associated protein YgaU
MSVGKLVVFSGLFLTFSSASSGARNKPPETVYPTTHDQQSLEDLLKTSPGSQPASAPMAPAPAAVAPAPVTAAESAPAAEVAPAEPVQAKPASQPAPEKASQPRLRAGGDVVRGDRKAPPAYKVWIWQENGDTLWRIAQKVYGDKDKWPLIYEANRDVIKDPNKIYPKQVLKIPPADWQP